MINKIFNALLNPQSFWREILNYALFNRKSSPQDWFNFRQVVGRECAVRRNPSEGVVKKNIGEIFPEITAGSCRVNLIENNAYNPTYKELIIISQIVEMLSPLILFEFGTFDGTTTLHLALNTPQDAIIYTIDIKMGEFEFGQDELFFKKISIGEKFINTPSCSKIKMLTGDSKSFDITEYLGKIDVIFVDGDHSYEGVMNDSKIAFQMSKLGSLIIWHDYLVIDDVTQAIIDLSKEKQLININGTSLVICLQD